MALSETSRTRSCSERSPATVPPQADRLRQAAIRRPGACPAIPSALHAPRCHIQPSSDAFENGNVTFRWKDYAHGNKKRKMTVTADEFLRRFCCACCHAGLSAFAASAFSQNASMRFGAALPAVADRRTAPTVADTGIVYNSSLLVLSSLRRGDGPDREAYQSAGPFSIYWPGELQ